MRILICSLHSFNRVYITKALCPQAIHQKAMNRTQSMYTLGGWHSERLFATSDNAARQYIVAYMLKPICVNRRLNSPKQTKKTSVSFTPLFINLSSLNLRDALKKEHRENLCNWCVLRQQKPFWKMYVLHSGGANGCLFCFKSVHYINNGRMIAGICLWTVCTGSFLIYFEFRVGFSIAVNSKMHRSINIWGSGGYGKYVP